MTVQPRRPPFLSVVVPAYDEEERLPATLDATMAYLRDQKYSFELAIVNDGSNDDTSRIAHEWTMRDPRIQLLEYGANRGKGYAVRYGMTRVSGSIRLFMDADNSTAVHHIAAFLPLFDRGLDVVIGSRRHPDARILVRQSWWKERLGDLGNAWIQFWTVRGIRDTQAGFKAFTARAAMDIFSRLQLDRWGFDIEALAVARQLGYQIAECPITWLNDPRTKVSSVAYLQVLSEVLQVRRNLRQGLYEQRPDGAIPAGMAGGQRSSASPKLVR